MRSHDPAAAPSVSRRQLIGYSIAGVAAGMFATPGQAEDKPTPVRDGTAFAVDHAPLPLPFDAAKLRGLSARLLESHWTNNYGGSVRALNETNRRLAAALADAELPAYTYNDLKREHLMRTGSVVLHELYFDNLGGNGVADSEARSRIASAFGSFDRWETEFRRIAAGLGGGSGWVMLGFNRQLRALENYWMADHMHAPVSTEPLLVLDMYEHSYHMDYGAAAARYVDAFFENVNWEVVAARFALL